MIIVLIILICFIPNRKFSRISLFSDSDFHTELIIKDEIGDSNSGKTWNQVILCEIIFFWVGAVLNQFIYFGDCGAVLNQSIYSGDIRAFFQWILSRDIKVVFNQLW